MNDLGIAAASGLRARMENLAILANNLANASTSGYKSDRELYRTYWSDASSSAVGDSARQLGVSPILEKQWIDFSQGAITATGVPTHLALNGPGFLSFQRNEEVVYSRDGHLQIRASGALVNGEGLPVLGVDGRPVQLDPAFPFEVRPNGEVWQAGASIGQIAMTEFPDVQKLERGGSNYFQVPKNDTSGRTAAATQVLQGNLEQSNTSPADTTVRMVNVLRQFEALQKALQIDSEMSRRLVEEAARL